MSGHSNDPPALAASSAALPRTRTSISLFRTGPCPFPTFPTRKGCATPQQKPIYDTRRINYARHFELDGHITYRSEVFSAEFKADGLWALKVRQQNLSGEENAVLHLQADAIIVATGANQVLKDTPDSLAGFTGQVLHSREYSQTFKDQVNKDNQRVLVVGGGESGADVCQCHSSPSTDTRLSCFGMFQNVSLQDP